MSDDYTPTTEDVAADYVANRLFVNANIHLTTSRVRDEFDRWLAEYTREQREIGWDEGFLAGEEYLVERAKGNFKYAEVFKVNPHRKG